MMINPPAAYIALTIPTTIVTQPAAYIALTIPTIIVTPPATYIALTIPTVIVTPPDAAELIELCLLNSPDVQNLFTMKHTTDQSPSQNSSKITMIEMLELTPQKELPEGILHSTKKAKTKYHQENQ